MKRVIFALFTVLAAFTEIFINKGFKIEAYKKNTKEVLAIKEGGSTCHSRSRS
jgi:hypothetical protein